MILNRGDDEPLWHGGDLGAARRRFPGAVEPFIDLSTGINPHPYPLPRLSADCFTRLPDQAALDTLTAAAARAYGAASAVQVVPAPGTQMLLPLVARLVPAGRAAVLTPGYPEYARAASLAGHSITAARGIDECGDAALVILGNPNNPDGRLFAPADILALATALRRRGGLLVIDEAFADVALPAASVAAAVGCGNIVVLRSFGKFFGLAGLRLGFALAAPPLAERLRATLGPWAVSGPALAVGARALVDEAWIARTRRRLDKAAAKLDRMLSGAGLTIVGGTSLFRLVQTPVASALFEHLGRSGIWVRAFPENTGWLRFGLPGDRQAWRRLHDTLASFRDGRRTSRGS